MHEWSEGFWAAVSVCVCSALVVVAIAFVNTGKEVTKLVYEDRALTEQMQEYREYGVYDGATCYPQDIISAVIQYRGTPRVRIVNTAGVETMSWGPATIADCYTASWILSKLNANACYIGSVVTDDNGSVFAIYFTEVP